MTTSRSEKVSPSRSLLRCVAQLMAAASALWCAVLVFAVCGCGSGALHEGSAASPTLSQGCVRRSPLDESFDEILVIERGVVREGGGVTPASRGAAGIRLCDEGGEPTEIALPLRHSHFDAKIVSHVGSVRVRQQYVNPYDGKIEAVYTFPLPQNAAVSDFVITVGGRTIRGVVREREQARQIYEAARAAGHVASLLDQRRPNIFTQSLANLEPSAAVDVEIEYFHTLRYDEGRFDFVVPTVVGPRFNPAGSEDPILSIPRGAPAASATAVTCLSSDEYSAHGVSIDIDLDAGEAVDAIESKTHPITVVRTAPGRARITLQEGVTIPNRDFVLSYRVPTAEVGGSVAMHQDSEVGVEGYLTALIRPPTKEHVVESSPPVEMTFVVDASGSMGGAPLAASKRAMRTALGKLRACDTFRMIRFSESSSSLGSRPVSADERGQALGRGWIHALRAGGGTHMLKGIRAALRGGEGSERRRIVMFLTDGFIGNEREVFAEVSRSVGDTRIFSFGVGESTNRYLLERLASFGRGVAAFVPAVSGVESRVDGEVERMFRRLARPALTELSLDFGGAVVAEVFPAKLPDLMPGQPLEVSARVIGDAPKHVLLRGVRGGERVSIRLDLAAANHAPAIAKLWARSKIRHLEELAIVRDESGESLPEITQLALTHGLVSRGTSFLAVDSSAVTEGSHGTTVPVAVPVPAGMTYETATVAGDSR